MTAALAPTSTTWVVIPCGAGKANRPAPARDFYTSTVFALGLAAAEGGAFDGEDGAPATVLVLSALHGLVTLDTVLAPYDTKMGDPGAVTAATVAAQAEALGVTWGDEVYALLPGRYLMVADEALRTLDVYVQDVYEVNAGIGDQRHICKVVAA